MQDYVLHGWNEEKCLRHRQNAKEGKFQTRCDREGICVYTGAPHTRLNYDEYDLLQDVFDYANTHEMLTKDRDRRQSIIYLSNKLAEMQAQKAKIDDGNTDWRTTIPRKC